MTPGPPPANPVDPVDPGGSAGQITPQEAELVYAGRLLDRQGIAMVLAVVDETGPGVPVTDEGTLADGARQAELLARFRSALRPDAADGDGDAVLDVVAVFSHADRPS